MIYFEGNFAWALADTRVRGKVRKTGLVFDKQGFATFLLRKTGGAWKVVHARCRPHAGEAKVTVIRVAALRASGEEALHAGRSTQLVRLAGR